MNLAGKLFMYRRTGDIIIITGRRDQNKWWAKDIWPTYRPKVKLFVEDEELKEYWEEV